MLDLCMLVPIKMTLLSPATQHVSLHGRHHDKSDSFMSSNRGSMTFHNFQGSRYYVYNVMDLDFG